MFTTAIALSTCRPRGIGHQRTRGVVCRVWGDWGMRVAVANHRVSRRLVDWVRVDDAEWRSGNIRIIRVVTADAVGETWYVKIKHRGRWMWAYSAQRPWGYGSAGQAKRGVSRWRRIHLYETGPQSEKMIRQQRKSV